MIWLFFSIPVIFALVIRYFNRRSSYEDTWYLGISRRQHNEGGLVLFMFIFGLAFICINIGIMATYLDARNIYYKKLYRTIEGRVEKYQPMPPNGRGTESFVVAGIPFTMRSQAFGFSKTAIDGSPIRAGLYVKTSYQFDEHNLDDNNILILKTE